MLALDYGMGHQLPESLIAASHLGEGVVRSNDYCCTGPSLGSGALHSGPHTYIASTLAPESSPQPSTMYLKQGLRMTIRKLQPRLFRVVPLSCGPGQ